MSRKKKIAVAASTFGVALTIGFVMQNGDAVASRMAPAETVPAGAVAPVVASAAAVSLPNITRDQAEAALPVIEMISLVDPDVETGLGQPASLADACAVTMDSQALPQAMVALSVSAPCQQSEYITVHHQGMMFKEITDENGQIDLIVPALAETAFYLLSFTDGAGAATSVVVPDYAEFDRAVLQWQGVSAVQLHALEFGADYGSDGHVWSQASRELDLMKTPTGGYLMTFGEPNAEQPLMAEVYTYPTGEAAIEGTVALSVEAEITASNCGREVAAQSIQFQAAQAPEALDLTMTLPGCDAIGEFLVLKNMFKDLTLAAK
mgnify:CR=1 FL=1